ncbi:hypothetical protein QBC46DRAFT_459999 [Diplogelasinospora grovesii]|uniref:Uncharacterized protein n=1 Tax=Diplogelasinospora grovesii TaxID=303347 RepID=A0AAN6N449_9PEZI|nr:hypothetical protein QBC46DRAFT_459999 [Diplogelasinospora grovesii]
MQLKHTLLAAAAASTVSAQRPADTSICDYYTAAVLENNTAENQLTLLTVLVNTVVIGNYTQPNVGIAVPGILAAGTFNGKAVNLLPYFTGDLLSTNTGGFLLTHLYQFFGPLLGCSHYSMPGFPKYGGDASMYEVHKFMDLDSSEMGYFIQQVALAAASFGVATDDIRAVGTALNGLFNIRCGPATEVIPGTGAQLQSICVAEDCQLSPNATCDKYESVFPPASASSTTMSGSMSSTTMMMSGSSSMSMTMSGAATTATTTGTMTASMSSSTPTSSVVTAGAAATGLSLMAVAGGFAALLL